MTRSIAPSLAGVLERLELNQPELVTSEDLARLVEETGLTYEVVCREPGHLACEWIDGMNVHHPVEVVPEPVLLRQPNVAEQARESVGPADE